MRRELSIGLLLSAFGCAASRTPSPESSVQSAREPAQAELEVWQPHAAPKASESLPANGAGSATPNLVARPGTCVVERALSEPPAGVAVFDESTVKDAAHAQWSKGFLDAIRTRLLAVQRCYEAALVAAPSLKGHIRLRLIFAKDGANILAAVEEDTLHAEPVTCCLLDNARSLRAPPPVEGTSLMVSFPFEFAAQTPASR